MGGADPHNPYAVYLFLSGPRLPSPRDTRRARPDAQHAATQRMCTARAMMHCRALLLQLCLSPVASLQLGGVLGRSGLLRTTPGPALRSCMPPRMQQRWGPVDVTLSKPLGLVLEEFGSGGTSGVVVVSLVEGGAAEESGDVSAGDRLSRVDGADVSTLDFDAVMKCFGEGCLIGCSLAENGWSLLFRCFRRFDFFSRGDLPHRSKRRT